MVKSQRRPFSAGRVSEPRAGALLTTSGSVEKMGMSKGAITLLVAAVFYCYASGAEVLLVKLMNIKPPHGAGVLLPLGTALLLNGYWPIQLVMYRFVWSKTASPRPLTWKHVRGYAIIGTMAAAVSALRCIGINYMPGSVYVIISTADLPMNTILSRLVLKKEFTTLQYVAVGCAMAGILVCLGESGGDAPADHPCDCGVEPIIGYTCSCIDDWGVYILVSLRPGAYVPVLRKLAQCCSVTIVCAGIAPLGLLLGVQLCPGRVPAVKRQEKPSARGMRSIVLQLLHTVHRHRRVSRGYTVVDGMS